MFFRVFLSPCPYAKQAMTKVQAAQTTASTASYSKVSFHWQGVASVGEVSSVFSGVDVWTEGGEEVVVVEGFCLVDVVVVVTVGETAVVVVERGRS